MNEEEEPMPETEPAPTPLPAPLLKEVGIDEEEEPMPEPQPDLRMELGRLLNRFSMENGSNTPDFILAGYLLNCLQAYDAAVAARDLWRGGARLPSVTS